jgi:hypothetical protein
MFLASRQIPPLLPQALLVVPQLLAAAAAAAELYTAGTQHPLPALSTS